jgi:hypothetical protein
LTRLLLRMTGMTDNERAGFAAHGRTTIARYRPEDFAEALWQAVAAGADRSERSPASAARLIMAALRHLARDPRAFHSIPD